MLDFAVLEPVKGGGPVFFEVLLSERTPTESREELRIGEPEAESGLQPLLMPI
jgi:hypothetical protein